MSNDLAFFVPYHTGYAHAELIHAFSSYTDVHLFIYKWNPARQRIREHFASNKKVYIDDFSVENILRQLREHPQRKAVVLLTASTNYLFGQLQVRLFRLIQEHAPTLIDVYPVGHCMYGCQSCAYGYTHRIPITFTSYIQRSTETLALEKQFEILICPSYSFPGAPFSFLSNAEIIQYIAQLKCSHAIKLHPLAYESSDTEKHPFLSLTDLEKEHVKILSEKSTSILPGGFANTLKLIEHARVIICDSNSSIPFETLYFPDKKYIFVYETEHDYDEQDDRQQFFHKFQTVEQLQDLLTKYFQRELECKTKDSHEFFLEKYDEPDGHEIERLAEIREWTSTEEKSDDEAEGEQQKNQQQQQQAEVSDDETVKQAIKEEFHSMMTPMALYVLGDYTMSDVVRIFFSEENQVFDTMLENASEL